MFKHVYSDISVVFVWPDSAPILPSPPPPQMQTIYPKNNVF